MTSGGEKHSDHVTCHKNTVAGEENYTLRSGVGVSAECRDLMKMSDP